MYLVRLAVASCAMTVRLPVPAPLPPSQQTQPASNCTFPLIFCGWSYNPVRAWSEHVSNLIQILGLTPASVRPLTSSLAACPTRRTDEWRRDKNLTDGQNIFCRFNFLQILVCLQKAIIRSQKNIGCAVSVTLAKIDKLIIKIILKKSKLKHIIKAWLV